MAGTVEQPGSGGASSAGEPGPLSRLLEELAKAPGDDPLVAWQEELKPGDRLDRFEIRRLLGRGGFGAVYEALDGELGRIVAIKTLRPGRSRRELAAGWIKKEAEAVARLSHPGIITLHDVCNCASGPYLVMERLEGRTLAERLTEGPLPRDEALRVAEEMAKALAHAHARGVLHRDLKPANVFLCEDGRVKLLDFGLAHLLGRDHASSGGTPAYMAPEQARGEVVDERADVYAAGMILGEMLSGVRPDAPRAVSATRPIARAAGLALSPDPDGRPRDGKAWLEALVGARKTMERPRAIRRTAVLAGGGLLAGALVAVLATWRGPSARPPPVPSVAVLPFADMSPQRDQEYLADGMAEEIIDALAGVEGMRVVGRTSSWFFKGRNARLAEIAKELGVGSVLEGSVRREGQRLRVSTKLVSVTDGRPLWTETFDRDLSDVFAVQAEIARSVAGALKVRLLGAAADALVESRRTSSEAYLHYLLGRQLYVRGSEEDIHRSVRAFEAAVASDPGFALGWADLAMALVFEADHARSPDESGATLRRAMEAADRAIALAPRLARTQGARGFLRADLRHEWIEGIADLQRAVALQPGDAFNHRALAWLLMAVGRFPEAAEVARTATEMDPLGARSWLVLATIRLGMGDVPGARESYERVLRIAPDHVSARASLAKLEILGGRPREALALADTHRGSAVLRLQVIALAEHDLGNARESQRALDEIATAHGHTMAFQIAEVHAYRGELDEAFRWLERADAQRDGGIAMTKQSPFLKAVRGDPRYVAFLRSMKLPVE